MEADPKTTSEHPPSLPLIEGEPPRQPPRSALAALALQRCPRCREGRVFRGVVAMHPDCPVCHLQFEREYGYFTGAMYFSYALGVVVILSFLLLLWLVFPMMATHWSLLIAWVAFLPMVPMIFRYSRVCWIHFERWIDPGI